MTTYAMCRILFLLHEPYFAKSGVVLSTKSSSHQVSRDIKNEHPTMMCMQKRGITNCSGVCCYLSALMQVFVSLGLDVFKGPSHRLNCERQGVDCLHCEVEDVALQLMSQVEETDVNPVRLVNLVSMASTLY